MTAKVDYIGERVKNIANVYVNPATYEGQISGTAKTQIVDGSGNIALVDSINGSLVIMEHEHHAVHMGIVFNLNVYSTVTAGTPKYCQFKTGSGYIHLKQKSISDGADIMFCQFIEAPTVTDGTIVVPYYNRNRNSSNTSTMVVYSNPTSISGGTVLEYDYMYATDTNQSASAATPSEMSLEWILKPNTSYIYKLENLGDGVANFLAKIMWYEH